MRLWHIDLLPYLPNQMIISQWRECLAIKRQWDKGTLKHRLVSYVMRYEKIWLFDYVKVLIAQMKNRNINYQKNLYDEFYEWSEQNTYIMKPPILRYSEHDDRYLKQCYYNLQEKYDREIISEDVWQRIERFMKEYGNEY